PESYGKTLSLCCCSEIDCNLAGNSDRKHYQIARKSIIADIILCRRRNTIDLIPYYLAVITCKTGMEAWKPCVATEIFYRLPRRAVVESIYNESAPAKKLSRVCPCQLFSS